MKKTGENNRAGHTPRDASETDFCKSAARDGRPGFHFSPRRIKDTRLRGAREEFPFGKIQQETLSAISAAVFLSFSGKTHPFPFRACGVQKNRDFLLLPRDRDADKMIAEDGSPFTAHTTNPVPVVLVCDAFKGAKLRSGGVLADLAPTLLDMMGIAVPAEMSGKTLIEH